jgi:hypothetical protein
MRSAKLSRGPIWLARKRPNSESLCRSHLNRFRINSRGVSRIVFYRAFKPRRHNAIMAALRVTPYWTTPPDHPAAPEVSLFRVLARRRPVVRVESKAVSMPLALPSETAPPLSRASFKPRGPIYAREGWTVSRAWNPWLWTR